MKVNREELLKSLESVAPGLTKQALFEQSDCLAFRDGGVFSFNDEMACRAKTPIDLEGVVPAKPLLELLKKLPDDEIDISTTDEGLLIKGKGRRSGIRVEQEVLLPVDEVKVPDDKDWKPLNESFSEAVRIVSGCAGKDESEETLTCIHITPKWIEASDRFQICRYPIETDLKRPKLVKATSLRQIASLQANQFSVADDWMHFRSDAGLILSSRLYIQKFPKLTKYLDVSGDQVQLPKNLENVLGLCEIFSSTNTDELLVRVTLTKGKIKLEGHGKDGWYAEQKKIAYEGDDLKFCISPRLLLEITKRSAVCEVGEGWMKVNGDDGKFVYVTATNRVD